MRRGPGVPVLALVLVITAGLGVVLSERAAQPPGLWLEAPAFVPVGEAFEVLASADRPVEFDLRYADESVRETAEVLRATLIARPGDLPITLSAADAQGAAATLTAVVASRHPAEIALSAPPRLEVGDPLVVRLVPVERPDGFASAIDDVQAWLDETPLPLRRSDDGWVALVGIPLADPSGQRLLRVQIRDERGHERAYFTALAVAANPREIQELRLSTEVLSVSTPEGRNLEVEAYAAAQAALDPALRWREPFLLPVAGGRFTSEFGIPRRYAAGGRVSHHLGTDIAAPEGTPIVATNDGVVKIAGFYPIKGGWVVVDHGGGVTSHYFHQSRIDVAVGDVLVRGDVIGAVGTTGLSSGPHLHWEMQIDGVPTHPMRWVGRTWPGSP
jgi:murein DD-endopeptidase MepM/ murein hydrolase activator NlpD